MSRESQPCVWMTAGLLRYRLCDRDLDCDRCPLDAALRGAPPPAGRPAAPPPAGGDGRIRPFDFPEDRRYGDGHTWVGGDGGAAAAGGEKTAGPPAGRLRIGLDALAAALLEAPRELRPLPAAADRVAIGEPLCELVLGEGSLRLASPAAGRAPRPNPAVLADPSLAVSGPYGEGWLMELRPAAGERGKAAADPLFDAAEARHRAALDLRHFRRRLALQVLAIGGSADDGFAGGSADDGVGETLPDGGEPVTDLRGLLGPRRYLDLLRELVH